MKSNESALVATVVACCFAALAQVAGAYQAAKPSVDGATTWTSVTTGKEYKVRVDGDHLKVDMILPPALRDQGAYFRCDLVRQQAGWIGTCISYIPYPSSAELTERKVAWCRIETKEQISLLTNTRIEGEFETLDNTGFDPNNCIVKKGPMKHFAWIPKK